MRGRSYELFASDLLGVAVITGLLGAYNIEVVQGMVWRAQAKFVYESRTVTWGSPKVLKE